MDSETEALDQFFAAINRNDMQAITKDFDPQIVRIEPEGFPTAGTYRGIEEVQEHVMKGRATWAEGTCNPEKFIVNGNKVVVYLHAWVRLNGSTDWGQPTAVGSARFELQKNGCPACDHAISLETLEGRMDHRGESN